MVSQNPPSGQPLTVGFAFVNQNPGSPEHLWIVVEVTSGGDAVIFNVTTERSDSDTTCRLKAGEHPFIVHDSVVAYNRGQLIAQAVFAQLQKAGYLIQPPASPALVKKIRNGARQSPFTPKKLSALL